MPTDLLLILRSFADNTTKKILCNMAKLRKHHQYCFSVLIRDTEKYSVFVELNKLYRGKISVLIPCNQVNFTNLTPDEKSDSSVAKCQTLRSETLL